MFMAVANFGVRPLSVLASIFLLRLLNPEDFGTVALAMILFNTANLFTDLGMQTTIVQTRDDLKKVTFYAFVVVNVASLLFYLLVFIFAPQLATLLGGDADLVPILRWLGIIIVLDGLWIIPEAVIRRDLDFKPLAYNRLLVELLSGIVAVVLAYLGFGIYALVFSTISAEAIRVIYLWWAAPRGWLKPARYDHEIGRHMFSYAVPTTTSGIMRYFSQHTDDWIVGRQLGTTALGYYSKAYDITSRLTYMFSNLVFGNILLPSYAKIQDDLKRLERAYLKSTTLVLLTMIPVSVGLAILADLIVPVLFGEKWLPMVVTWQIFSLYALTRPISANSSPLFQAVGKPGYNLQATIVVLVIMIPLVFLLIGPYGINGAAIAVSTAYFIAMLFNVWQVNRILPGSALRTLTTNLSLAPAGLVMGLVVYLAEDPIIELFGGQNWASLLVLVAIGAVVYISLAFLLQRPLFVELYQLAGEALGLHKRFPRFFQPRARKQINTP
jgi:PST family polysaccharide transporter